MRLIDADALILPLINKTIDAVEHAPTVEPIKVGDVCKECWRDGGNAVEVVRCKDCKYCDTGIDEEGNHFLKCLGWIYGGTKEDDYCSHGERRSE